MGACDLTLVVPTVPGRERLLSRMLHGLGEQMCPEVEVLVVPGDGQMGDKVTRAVAAASGGWLCVVDDDDWLAADFVDTVLAGLEDDPDMVGYRIASMCDGALVGMIEHHVNGDVEWSGVRRGPCPKMPTRVDVWRRFPLGNEYTADRVWCRQTAAVLRSGVFVDRTLYWHDYWTAGRPDVGVWPFDPGVFVWL